MCIIVLEAFGDSWKGEWGGVISLLPKAQAGSFLNNPELIDFAEIRSDADTDGFYKQFLQYN